MQDTKKVAGELLVELEKKGVTFETVDGKLKYKDSKGNFTENSKEKVKKYKEEKPLNIFSGFSQGFRAYSGVKPRKKSRSRRWFLHWDCG